jgi:hypothetical protein
VTVDDIHGILTAQHVVELLEKSKQVGLVLAGSAAQPHKILLNMDHCGRVVFGPRGQPLEGPDLAFLMLPPDTAGTLKAKKTFYNLTLRRERMLDRPEPLGDGFWVLSGFGGEWTDDAATQQGFGRIKVFKGMHGIGKVAAEHVRGAFDYLLYGALYNELYEGPNSYGGFSGGALWHVLMAPNGKEVAERLLSGVAFYESGEQAGAGGEVTNEITCHGRRSVYGTLIEAVRAVKKT